MTHRVAVPVYPSSSLDKDTVHARGNLLNVLEDISDKYRRWKSLIRSAHYVGSSKTELPSILVTFSCATAPTTFITTLFWIAYVPIDV